MDAHKEQNSYRTIAKGTAIFGGVQVFQILINIVRAKFVAIFLGPEGMGIMSLFTSTAGAINQATSLGLPFSAVKDIAQANQETDQSRLSRIVWVFRKATTITAILAAVVSIAAAPWLSEFTFGTRDYTWGFVGLSIMLFFTAKGNAETSILQALRELKSLAKSTLIGALVSLTVGVPMFAIWGSNGIVPAIAVGAVSLYAANRYFTSKIKFENPKLSTSEQLKDSRGMISLGVVMMVSVLIGTITVYLLNVFIRKMGDASDVGLYQAASSLTNQYVNLVFAAMAADYFPRLAAAGKNNAKVSKIVTNQMEITMLIVVPLVIAMMVTAPIIIKILLSDAFLVIAPLLCWLAIGLIFKAMTYSIGYISISKGDKKTFFWYDAVIGNTLTLAIAIAGYMLYGLVGLGIAFMTSYIINFIMMSIVVRVKYQFKLTRQPLLLIAPLMAVSVGVFLLFDFYGYNLCSYCIGGGLLALSVFYSYYKLNKMIGITELVRSKVLKKSNDEQ